MSSDETRVQVTMTRAEAELVRGLLDHRRVSLLTDAAYVAYSSAWNASPKRVAERTAQREGAAECALIVDKFKAVLGGR